MLTDSRKLVAQNSIFDAIILKFAKAMNDPNSQVYLPKIIKAQNNPSYEPYDAGDLSFGNIGNEITLDFSKVIVSGLSTAQVDGTPSTRDESPSSIYVSSGAVFSMLTMASPLIVSFNGQDLKGAVRVSVLQSKASISVHVTSGGDNLNANVTALNFMVNKPYISNINIKVNYDPNWDNYIDSVLNTENRLEALISKLADKLNSESTRSDFSKALTDALNRILL